MHFSHKYGWRVYQETTIVSHCWSQFGNSRGSEMCLLSDRPAPLWSSGTVEDKGSQRWWQRLRGEVTIADNIRKEYRLSLGNTNTKLDIWGWKRNHRHNDWTSGIERKGNEKREQMGKEIKEESRKRQQERRKQRSWLVLLLNTSEHPGLWLKCLPMMKMRGNKTSTSSGCVAHRYTQVKYLERHTRFWNEENIKQNKWKQKGNGMRGDWGLQENAISRPTMRQFQRLMQKFET